DPNDFALAQKYHLDMPICMNDDGTMNEMCGKYAGMDRFECREALVHDFETDGVVDHIEEHVHPVGHSQRTGVIVEPYLSKQWFVKMKPLAQEVLEHQAIEDQKIHFVPNRFEKTFTQWLENIEDWCISRQLWWGHRIPAWTHKETGEIYVGMDDPKDPENWIQDEDVLDTWFSSGLWPFSTLGWPQDTPDLERYFPNDCLVTGYDIIFFWVARMAFQTRFCMKNRPFKDVLIHGLVRDSQGRKMSKSLGNGIDPMDVIEKKGADALRFFLSTNSTPGQDLRFDETKLDSSWNFINKIWNAARYVQMQCPDSVPVLDPEKLSSSDQWIVSRFNEVLRSVTNNMEKYELAIVGNELYNFVWDDFCSWYIELSKSNLHSENKEVVDSTKAVLYTMLINICKLLSPFMPFVTEEIYCSLPHEKESINLESWPQAIEFDYSETDKKEMEIVMASIETVREVKTQYDMKPSETLNISIRDENGQWIPLTDDAMAMLDKMAHAVNVDDLHSTELLTRTMHQVVFTCAMDSLIDYNKEKEKLSQELKRLENEIKRSQGMLNNPGFVNKAPQEKVQQEKEKLQKYQEQSELTQKQLIAIEKKMQG
ncbi:MAG: valine--tRNA ligase, partial [Erysipelotrichaceae bacterium]|nr:valine--tRNA ligase [Erysipelotrichaceae bacterium]